MAKTNRTQLRKILRDARNKLDAIERKEKEKELRPLIGKYFKYCNSFGGGEDWWLYRKVLGINKDIWLDIFEFQKTTHGDWMIHFGDSDMSLLEGHAPITDEEFNQAWAKCLAELSGYNVAKVKP